MKSLVFSQAPSCPSPLLYLVGPTSTSIQVYDPNQPFSVNNPSSTNVPVIGFVQYESLGLMANVNGGTLSPTFYATACAGLGTIYYNYWDGSAWVPSNTISQEGALNCPGGLAGCGSFLYEVITTVNSNTCAVYKYNGTGTASLVASFPYGLSIWDIVADCNCNFYLLDNLSPQSLHMYNSNGVALCSYSLTSPVVVNPFTNGQTNNGGLAMIGNTVYARASTSVNATLSGNPNSGFFYAGLINGASISFTAISGMPPAYDFASCPVCNTNSITAAVIGNTITCYNPTTNITVTVNSVLSPVSFLWTGPGIVGTATNAAVAVNAAGNYTCTINAGGCPPLQPATQTIVTVAVATNTIAPTAAITPTGTVCFYSGQQLSTTSLGPNFTNQWAGPGIIGVVNSPTLGVLAPGIHSLYVTSSLNGCSSMATVNVLPPPNIGFVLSSNSVCAQNFNGSANTIALTPSGATNYTLTGNATFTISSPNGPLMLLKPVAPFSALPVTTTATLSAYNGFCYGAITASFSIIPNPTVSVVSPTAMVCAGYSQVFSAVGATVYSWSPPAGLNSITGASVSANPGVSSVYSVFGSDFGCYSASQGATLIVNPTPTVSAVGSTVCTSQSMSLSANSVAGATYNWSGPFGFSSNLQNISIASPSVAQSGIYNLIVTSAAGCTNTANTNVSIVLPPNLSIALSSQSMCAQALSGSPNTIILTGAGAATYTLSTPNHISNSNPSGPNSNLSLLPPYILPGPATATLLGSNGICTMSLTSTFTVIPNPTVSISNPTPVICAGQSFTYTSSGANSYSWSSANPNNYIYTTGNIAVANPSINSVFSVVGGSLGCLSALQSSSITVNPLPVFNITGNPVICPGTSATLSAMGNGTSYTWSPAAFLNTNNGFVVVASPPALQNYLVLGALNNCTTAALVTVSVLPLPVAQIMAPKTVFCQDEEIELLGGGGPMPIGAYNWTGPVNYQFSGKDLQLKAISPAYGGTYTLSVNDQNNCKGSSTQTITVYSLPQGYLSAPNMQGCAPLCADLKFKSIPGTASITDYSWQVENTKFSASGFKYCFLSAADYTITGDLTDVNNCSNTITAIVKVYPKPQADFDFNPAKPIENLETVQFINASQGAEQFVWEFGKSGYSSNKKDPSFLFESSGTYPVVLVASNQWNCSDTVVKVIHVASDFAVYVPNAFTPNQDGLNEQFVPVLRGSKDFTFTIFDRWGNKVFETSDITKGWDGTFKGEACVQGVYVWKLVVSSQGAVTANNGLQIKNLTGEVLLYR